MWLAAPGALALGIREAGVHGVHSHSNNSFRWVNAVTHVPSACLSVSEAEDCGLWAVGGTLSLFSMGGGECHLGRSGNGQSAHQSLEA